MQRASLISARSVAFVAMTLVCAREAAAQAPQAQAPGARTLFEEGMDLKRKGDLGAACQKFRASLGQQRAASTLAQVAECDAKDGRLLAALAGYRSASEVNAAETDATRRAGRDKAITEETAKLQARIPKLRITGASWPEGSRVTRDGQAVPAAELGAAIDVDPGKHMIVAEAPGHRRHETEVTLAEGETRAIALPWLPASPATASAPPAFPLSGTLPVSSPATTLGSERIAGIAAGGLGVVLLGLAAGFGVDAQSKNIFGDLKPYNSTGAALGLAIAGGTVLLSGVALFVIDDTNKPSSSIAGIHTIVAAAGPVRVAVTATW